jgi:hypothetical protein
MSTKDKATFAFPPAYMLYRREEVRSTSQQVQRGNKERVISLVDAWSKTDKRYVTMTDRILTRELGKIVKKVYECEHFAESLTVMDNVENIMAICDKKLDNRYYNINILVNKPYYNKATHVTYYMDKVNSPKYYTNNDN